MTLLDQVGSPRRNGCNKERKVDIPVRSADGPGGRRIDVPLSPSPPPLPMEKKQRASSVEKEKKKKDRGKIRGIYIVAQSRRRRTTGNEEGDSAEKDVGAIGAGGRE